MKNRYTSYQTRRVMKHSDFSQNKTRFNIDFISIIALAKKIVKNSKEYTDLYEIILSLVNLFGYDEIDETTPLISYPEKLIDANETIKSIVDGKYPEINKILVEKYNLDLHYISYILISTNKTYFDFLSLKAFEKEEFMRTIKRNPFYFCGEFIVIPNVKMITNKMLSKKMVKSEVERKHTLVKIKIMFLAISAGKCDNYNDYKKLIYSDDFIFETPKTLRLTVINVLLENLTNFTKSTLNKLIMKKWERKKEIKTRKGEIDFNNKKYPTFIDRYNAMCDVSKYHSDGLKNNINGVKVTFKKRR